MLSSHVSVPSLGSPGAVEGPNMNNQSGCQRGDSLIARPVHRVLTSGEEDCSRAAILAIVFTTSSLQASLEPPHGWARYPAPRSL